MLPLGTIKELLLNSGGLDGLPLWSTSSSRSKTINFQDMRFLSNDYSNRNLLAVPVDIELKDNVAAIVPEGVAPKVLSHCLSGDNTSGGILVLGEIVEPNIVYSPLVPNLPHYNLHLLNITVNGQALPINPSVFAASTNGGTIVDSRTTLVYLAQDAYDPFVNAITNVVSQYVMPVDSRGTQCYAVTSSINNIFPQVVLHFAGGATIVIGPNNYLLEQDSIRVVLNYYHRCCC